MAKTARLDETPKARLTEMARPGKAEDKPKASDTPVFGTRLDPKLVKRIRICGAHEDMTMQEFIAEAIEAKLKEMNY
jgi:hypothetical protein